MVLIVTMSFWNLVREEEKRSSVLKIAGSAIKGAEGKEREGSHAEGFGHDKDIRLLCVCVRWVVWEAKEQLERDYTKAELLEVLREQQLKGTRLWRPDRERQWPARQRRRETKKTKEQESASVHFYLPLNTSHAFNICHSNVCACVCIMALVEVLVSAVHRVILRHPDSWRVTRGQRAQRLCCPVSSLTFVPLLKKQTNKQTGQLDNLVRSIHKSQSESTCQILHGGKKK